MVKNKSKEQGKHLKGVKELAKIDKIEILHLQEKGFRKTVPYPGVKKGDNFKRYKTKNALIKELKLFGNYEIRYCSILS